MFQNVNKPALFRAYGMFLMESRPILSLIFAHAASIQMSLLLSHLRQIYYHTLISLIGKDLRFPGFTNDRKW